MPSDSLPSLSGLTAAIRAESSTNPKSLRQVFGKRFAISLREVLWHVVVLDRPDLLDRMRPGEGSDAACRGKVQSPYDAAHKSRAASVARPGTIDLTPRP